MEVFKENDLTKRDEFGTKVNANSLEDIPTSTDDNLHVFQSSFEYDNLLNDNIHIPNSIPNLSPSHTYPYPNVRRSLQTRNPNGQPPPQDLAPPLLPAFLITGLLLAVIVCIIVWRHFTERRRRALGLDDGDVDIWGGGDAAEGFLEKPKMWDVFVSMVSEGGDGKKGEKWKGWESVMPLSAKPFFVPTKNLQPRYLVPSDRPTTFMTRMFGGALEGYRFRYSSTSRMPGSRAGGPLMSTIAPTNRLGMGMGMGMRMRSDDVNDPRGWNYDPETEPDTDTFSTKRVNSQEDQIEKVQLSFIIAMPSEHHSRSKKEMEKRRMVGVRRSSGEGSSKAGSDGGGDLEWMEGGEKERKSVSVPSLIEEEGGLPELCLGSLTIPYG